MAITLSIKRQTFTPKSTIGTLFIDGLFFCYTIERPRADIGTPATLLGPDGQNHPCIPAGVYQTKKVVYDHLNLLCFELQNVPGRTSILIHPANFASQLLGCIAPGQTNGVDTVGQSDNAYVQLMGKTANQDVIVDIS
jgi:hypothetical protein